MAFGAACFPALCMDRMIHEPWIIRWSHDVLGLMLRSVSPMAEPAGTQKNGAELGNVTLGVQKGGQDPRGGSLQHPSCIFPAAMWDSVPRTFCGFCVQVGLSQPVGMGCKGLRPQREELDTVKFSQLCWLNADPAGAAMAVGRRKILLRSLFLS